MLNSRFQAAYDRMEQADQLKESILEPPKESPEFRYTNDQMKLHDREQVRMLPQSMPQAYGASRLT